MNVPLLGIIGKDDLQILSLCLINKLINKLHSIFKNGQKLGNYKKPSLVLKKFARFELLWIMENC